MWYNGKLMKNFKCFLTPQCTRINQSRCTHTCMCVSVHVLTYPIGMEHVLCQCKHVPAVAHADPLTIVIGWHWGLLLLAAHVDLGHGCAQLACGTAHLLGTGGLGQGAGNDLKHTCISTTVGMWAKEDQGE